MCRRVQVYNSAPLHRGPHPGATRGGGANTCRRRRRRLVLARRRAERGGRLGSIGGGGEVVHSVVSRVFVSLSTEVSHVVEHTSTRFQQ